MIDFGEDREAGRLLLFNRVAGKSPKSLASKFLAKRRNKRQSPVDVSSSAPAKLPVSSSPVDVVPHMIIR
jgi:hypothetical protein